MYQNNIEVWVVNHRVVCLDGWYILTVNFDRGTLVPQGEAK